jgi:hypothetical protein
MTLVQPAGEGSSDESPDGKTLDSPSEREEYVEPSLDQVSEPRKQGDGEALTVSNKRGLVGPRSQSSPPSLSAKSAPEQGRTLQTLIFPGDFSFGGKATKNQAQTPRVEAEVGALARPVISLPSESTMGGFGRERFLG